MKRKLCVAVWGMSLLTACSIPKAGAPEWFENAVETSGRQLLYMAEQLENVPDTACFPRSVKEDGSYRLENAKDWTSGFYPGSMWLAYDLTGDEALANLLCQERSRSFHLYVESKNKKQGRLGSGARL